MDKKLSVDKNLVHLFDEYEKAFSALDFERSASFFADSFISAGPKGTIARSKSEFLTLAKQAAGFYRSVGQEYAKILSLSESQISDQYSLVAVHWGAKFKKTGEKLIEFDVSYIIDKTQGEPKIILFIAHQDEQEAMKKLGLI